MDARSIYSLMKPHLDDLDVSEKKVLSQLITKGSTEFDSCTHREVVSLAAAKERLKLFCRREMERERVEKRDKQL